MSIKAETGFSLKDQLFNADTVGLLATQLNKADPKFNHKKFSKVVLAQFPQLELKARIEFMATTLLDFLPSNFPSALKVLHKALPPPLDPTKTDDDFGAFIWSVPSEYVAKQGCTAEHLDRSLAFLQEATQRFSAEFSIRPFLADFPEQTLSFIETCASHDNYHVRRLASEGIRPYLPWAQRVIVPPPKVVAVLNKLHADPTRFVTRSVANTLNDLSRTDAELVLATLKRWQKSGQQTAAELDWMTRHTLRTLVKQDNGAALELLGYPTKPKFKLSNIEQSNTVTVGEALHWHGTLTSLADQKLKIALRVHFLKANGSLAPKVFAVKEIAMQKGEVLKIAKKIPIKPMTTRTLYAGQHAAELVVNGVNRGKADFELLA